MIDLELNNRINALWVKLSGDQVELLQEKFYGYITANKTDELRALIEEYPIMREIAKVDQGIILGPVYNYQPEMLQYMVAELGLDIEYPRQEAINRTLLLEVLNRHHSQHQNVNWLTDRKFYLKCETVDMLLALGAKIDAVDYLKNTALHYAISCLKIPDILQNSNNDGLNIIRLLLRYGANPNLQNYYGYTALHAIILKKDFPLWVQERIIKLLVSYGADDTILSQDGISPKMMALRCLSGVSCEITRPSLPFDPHSSVKL